MLQANRWRCKESYDTAKEGLKIDAETQRKIEGLETSITETNDLATRYNSQLKSVVDALELNVFFPKLAESITGSRRYFAAEESPLARARGAAST